MLQGLKRLKNKIEFELSMSPQNRLARRQDYAGLSQVDPGSEACISAAVTWLKLAQELSASNDGGYARDYNLLSQKWSTSYPETTGYIIPTLLEYAKIYNDNSSRCSAIRALDWCVKIQLECGGFQAGKIDANPVVPVTFNTGQILIGLAAGVTEVGPQYLDAMHQAGDWLVNTIDDDGCWRTHGTPYAATGEKAYETHVSWGLFEAAKISPARNYGEIGIKQVKWALTKQIKNGWFDSCCLDQPASPLTHTLGYVLRGVIEGYLWSRDQDILDAALVTATALAQLVDDEGFLAGRFNSQWQPQVNWVCLTGSAQIAACLYMLNDLDENPLFLSAAQRLTSYVRRSVVIEGEKSVVGGVKGAFPLDGDYGSFQFLNWAAKFVIDAAIMDVKVTNNEKIITTVKECC